MNLEISSVTTYRNRVLNKYFSTVFVVDNGVIPDNRTLPLVTNPVDPWNSVFFSPIDIKKIIDKLKSKGSAGKDDIPHILFMHLSSVISFPLSMIFNLSMLSSTVPTIRKSAIIVPAFKTRSSSDPSNFYRPISLTCIACKVMESGVKNCLLKHLRDNNLIFKQQHCFLSKRSIFTQRLEYCNDWRAHVLAKRKVYLDFRKAFDS